MKKTTSNEEIFNQLSIAFRSMNEKLLKLSDLTHNLKTSLMELWNTNKDS